MNGNRPFGVSLLAINHYAGVIWAGAISIALVASPTRLDLPADTSLWKRTLWSILALIIGWLIYLWARGLWRLRNWARRLQIALALLTLISLRGLASISPALRLIPKRPIREILGLLLVVAILFYLFSPSVKRAFGVSTGWYWQLAVGILCLASVGLAVYKSKAELMAFRWHRQHGDTITVNGVRFPVYEWDAPSQENNGLGFQIDSYRRGPFLHGDSTYSLTVEGYRKESALPPDQRADKKMLEYQKAGYSEVNKFQLAIAKQTLSCVREHLYAYSVYCYGDGPIYQLFFAGDDTSLERFNQTVAAAR
jgi:hypothetical protein